MTDHRHYTVEWLPDAFNRVPTEDEVMRQSMCFTADEIHYCKAKGLFLSVLPVDGVHWVSLGLSIRNIGMHMPFAPDTAREMARGLLSAADKADELNAAASAAQLAAALAKGGQANG